MANYVEVNGFLYNEGKISGVKAFDKLAKK